MWNPLSWAVEVPIPPCIGLHLTHCARSTRPSPQYMWNPLSWAMEAAAIIAIALLDYADFALILALLLVRLGGPFHADWSCVM